MTTSEPQIADTDIYTVRQTAELLGLHYNTVVRKADEGALPPIVGKAFSRNRFFTGKTIKKFWRER